MKQDIKPEPTQHECNKAYVSLCEHADRNRMHAYKTGRFTIKSIRGYEHILISYVHDTNTILYRPLKTKIAEELQ